MPDRGTRDERSVFLILLGLYFLILYPILRADRYYNDDLKRALFGRASWDSNGRPLTTLLMRALQCYDHAMVDISPLTQVGAIAILAWIGVLSGRRFAIRSPWMAALVAFPLGAQPFFLENLSYKFDALSMSLALLLALLPIIGLRPDRRGWWLGVLALFASLSFYQPAITACLIFILLEFVLGQLHEESPQRLLRRFLRRALQVGLAMLIYELVIGIHISGWVRRKSEMIHGWRELPRVGINLRDFGGFIGTSFNEHWWMYFGPVLLVLAAVPVVIGVRHALGRRPLQSFGLTLVLCGTSVLLPLAALACVPGPMLLLRNPEIEPRVLMGVGALLVAALIAMQAALQRWRRAPAWTLSLACMLALGMSSFASAYGNALGEQKAYEQRIAGRLADDLAGLQASRGIHAFVLDGSAGYGPVTAHVIEQLPLVRELVPTYLTAGDGFNTRMFLDYYLAGMTDLRFSGDPAAAQLVASSLARSCQLPALDRTAGYDLYAIDGVAVVKLGAADARHCLAGSTGTAVAPIRPTPVEMPTGMHGSRAAHP